MKVARHNVAGVAMCVLYNAHKTQHIQIAVDIINPSKMRGDSVTLLQTVDSKAVCVARQAHILRT